MKGGRLNLEISGKLSQKLHITPQMKQSLTILQMPITELLQEINTYIEENPVLEETENRENSESVSEDNGEEIKEDTNGDELDKIDWEEFYRDNNDITFTPSDDEGYDLEKFVSGSKTLYEHLMDQLKTSGCPKEIALAAGDIIGNLSEEGYFLDGFSEVAGELSLDEDIVESALMLVQTFDPAGIAARNLKECINLQLAQFDVEPVYVDFIAEMLEKYEKELIAYKYDEIKSGLCIEDDTFEYMMFLMRKTDPKPGLSFGGASNQAIKPDVYIVKKDEEYDIILNEEGIPALRMNTYYLNLLKNKSLDGSTKEYIEEKVKNALWLIKSLNKRQKAIYRVVKVLTEVQSAFLGGGVNHLKPLKLKDVADATGLHESTVSRVTAGKYAMTQHGLIELKSFFVKGLDTDSGEDMSTQKVKNMIKDIVDSENPEKPYSDQKIEELLNGQGINIARRTVAKYRDELGIPTKSQRKRIRR